MSLNADAITKIRAHLAAIHTILDTPDPDTIAAWVGEHIHPAPGTRILARTIRDACAADLQRPDLSVRAVGAHIPAPRIRSNGSYYYANVTYVP